MTALTRAQLLHGSGARAWEGVPVPTFDVDELVELEHAGDVDHVTITGRLSRRRYGVKFTSGAELIVDALMLRKVRS